MININSLLDEWENPIKELYEKEKEILSNGVCFKYTSDSVLISNINKIFQFGSHRISYDLFTQSYMYMQLPIYSDEWIEFSFFDHSKQWFSTKKLVARTNELMIHVLMEELEKVKERVYFVVIKVSRSMLRDSFEKKQYFHDLKIFIEDRITIELKSRTNKKIRDVIKNVYKSKNLIELSLLLKSLELLRDSKTMTISQFEKYLQDQILAYPEQVKLKEEYLQLLKESTQIEPDEDIIC